MISNRRKCIRGWADFLSPLIFLRMTASTRTPILNTSSKFSSWIVQQTLTWWLCEYISKLVSLSLQWHGYIFTQYLVSHEVRVSLNVLGPLIEYKIRGNVQRILDYLYPDKEIANNRNQIGVLFLLEKPPITALGSVGDDDHHRTCWKDHLTLLNTTYFAKDQRNQKKTPQKPLNTPQCLQTSSEIRRRQSNLSDVNHNDNNRANWLLKHKKTTISDRRRISELSEDHHRLGVKRRLQLVVID
jgi:hypothetical protein